jgi:hypothetical protein
MPQPIRKGGANVTPDVLLSRQAAAANLANALANWNGFEAALKSAYALAMSSSLPQFRLSPDEVEAGWRPCHQEHPIGVQVFDALSSLNVRLDLLGRLLSEILPDTAANFQKLRPEIRKAAGKRATIAHGQWGTTNDYPDDLLLVLPQGRLERWTCSDFLACAERFKGLRNQFLSSVEIPLRAELDRRRLPPV